MGKSDNIVTILIIAAAAFLYFRFAKDPTGLRTLYKETEKYVSGATAPIIYTDPCDPYRLHGYTAYLACKAGIIGNTAEQGGDNRLAPVKCPYDQSLLIGDRNCKMPTSGEQTLKTGISPFTNAPWLPQGGWI